MRRVIAAMLSLFVVLPVTAAPFSNIYFFGDSLTDTGNVTKVYESVAKPPGAPAVIPGPPYDAQGRASNGPLYADVLAGGLGFQAQPSAAGGNNFAFGGARTRYQLFGPPFLGIADQVTQFRAQSGAADPSALYVLWAGSNNLQDIFLRRTTDVLGQPIPTVGQTLGDIGSMVSGLYAEGARNLLVPNVANLGRVPRVSELGGAPAQAAATALVQGFNSGLDTLLGDLQASNPGLNIIRFDTFSTFEAIVANAPAYGLLNTTDRCYTGDDTGFTGGGAVCARPDQYLFWDGIHPTTVAHNILGQAMLQTVLAAVPESQTWALMLIGLAVLGVGTHRRAH